MQDKHKVTLYLPPELHRQLKITSAVSSEPMSALAERALEFYLTHPEVVEEVEAIHGRVHQIYHCPDCASALVIREGELTLLGDQPGIAGDDISVPAMAAASSGRHGHQDEELVPC